MKRFKIETKQVGVGISCGHFEDPRGDWVRFLGCGKS